jgi:60 kDa SS-A/Ro ribonucleoprotein
MGPQTLRMNLNTLLRHDALSGDLELVMEVAGRIADPDEIRRSRQFPYQYLAAYLNAEANLPLAIREALGRAAETACGNVPALPEPVVIGLDVSGSMGSAITGHRGRGATSKVRCVDVAALFAAALVRRNPGSVVIPFDTSAYNVEVGANESILDLAGRLARYGGGGTDCSLPLAEANRAHRDRRFAGCVLVSDMESWVGTGTAGSTGVMTQWQKFVANQKRRHGSDAAGPKLVCINLQAYTTTQAPERDDVLNVGGFSDAVFGVVASFLGDEPDRFVREVEAIEL